MGCLCIWIRIGVWKNRRVQGCARYSADLHRLREWTPHEVSNRIDNGFCCVSGSHSAAGTVLAVIFCLLLAAVLILAAVYFTRRPYRLPTFLLKLTQRTRMQTQTNGTTAVAFENPGYDREAQVSRKYSVFD